MKLQYLLFFLLTKSFYIHAEQFVYPVAALDHEGKEILVVHQKSLYDVELLIWNSTSKRASKGLLSTYIPAGIKMLPSGVGFSFIDEGRLRVKNFYKRLPKTIAIYEPISKITDINWISDDAFYFSAKEGNAYNIFSSNTLGEVQRCTFGQDCDYVYPCKIGKEVFCIEREKKSNFFKIVKIKWELCAFDCKNVFHETKESVLSIPQPISYLYMISDEEGFYLDYSSIDSQAPQDLLLFSCCRIFKDEHQNWSNQTLFTFKIPSLYVIGKEQNRLYESITPLLPHYTDVNYIYFIDAHNEGFFELKQYDKQNNKIKVLNSCMKNSTEYSKCICPLLVGNILYSGFVLDDESAASCLIDMDGTIFLELPELVIES